MLLPRALSFTVLLTIFLTAVLSGSGLGRTAFMLLAILLAYGAVWEFLDMCERLHRPAWKKSSAVIGVIVISAAFFPRVRDFEISGLAALAAAAAWFMLLFGKNRRDYLDRVFNSLLGLIMVLLPLIPLVLIYCDHRPVEGRFMVLYLILVTKAGDTGAYLVGTLTHNLIGRNHKIIPGISPKKSWEGTCGGMILSLIISIILWRWLLDDGNMLLAAVTGIVLFWGGFAGDLVESVLKRTAGVKDSNTIIPGMGGVLDVVDSLLLNAPVFYYVFLPLVG
ncbi:MAG: phosphatidate cytidylyltransferase [Victivallales bacterium]|nr:phosphatidate cytidylyltransferase [Victivallales bacterium]